MERSLPLRKHRHLLVGLGQMGAEREVVFPGEGGREGVEIAGDRVGGMRGNPEATATLTGPFKKMNRPGQGLGRLETTPHIQNLETPPDADR